MDNTQTNPTPATAAIEMNDTAKYHLKRLKARYNARCNWVAKCEAHKAGLPLNNDGTPNYRAPSTNPITSRPPSKNSKWAAYEATEYFIRQGVVVEDEDRRSVRAWRVVLVALNVKNVKPLPECNRRKAA